MIREAYAKYFATRFDARNTDSDREALHVSDLAKCSREVWARRNGKALLPFDDDTLRKFDIGFDIESRVGLVLSQLEGYEVISGYVHRLGEAIGHSDFVVLHKTDPSKSFICEVKSTTFTPKMVNKKRIRVAPTAGETQWHYRIQAASYALERQIERFCLEIVCRESGMMAECWYKTADYVESVTSLLAEKTKLTYPSSPMPPAEPPEETYNWKGESWACKYCTFSACEKNENPASLELAS